MKIIKRVRTKIGPLLSKALFVFGIALLFSAIVITGIILFTGHKGKKETSTGTPGLPALAKIEKPQLPIPPKPHLHKAKVAIVIDDLGLDIERLRDILDIDAPIAVAVLPFLPYSREIAEEASLSGREVLLHLPMEPKDSANNDPGEGAVFTYMSEAEVAGQVRKDIAAIPHIVGINNHMGSKFTENEKLMKIVLETAKERNLFFLDSKTTNKSAAHRLAKEMGLKTASRHVFLDNNKDDVEYIKGQILELIEIAKKRGAAVGIGHPHQTTITAIKEMLPMLNEDVEVVPLSPLIDSMNE